MGDSMVWRPETGFRVVGGDVSDEEVAALVAVLAARGRAGQGHGIPTDPDSGMEKASWRRRERVSGFRPGHSWRG